MQEYKTKILDPKFRNTFTQELNDRVKFRDQNSEEGVLDIIMELCEKHDVEPDSISSLVTGTVKQKLRAEATDRHLLTRPKKKKLI